MRRPTRTDISVRKAAYYAVATNGAELTLVLGLGVWSLLSAEMQAASAGVRFAVLAACLMVSVAAVLDIREALQLRRLLDRLDAMEATITQMEGLNNTLRAQRHDFLNHLQVVYSLMEMKEYDEASAYLEKVYGSITSVSRFMKTAHASVNALLQAKLTACEQQHIEVKLSITGSWRDMAIPGWEMCKVLSNLIDNAMDALRDV